MSFIKSLCLVINTIASLVVVSIVSVYILSDYGLIDIKGNLPSSQNHTDEHLIEIYGLISRIDNTNELIRRDYARICHYVSGHEIKNGQFTDFCPECGLLQQLDLRERELQKELDEVSLHKDPESIKRCNEITKEMTLIKSHLYSSDEISERVNKSMRKIRLIGNDTVKENNN